MMAEAPNEPGKLQSRPLFWITIFLGINIAYHIGGGYAIRDLLGVTGELPVYLANKFGFAAILVALFSVLGLWRATGFIRHQNWSWALWAAPLWIASIFLLPLTVLGLLRDPTTSMGLALVALAVGFVEEAVFRGVILHALLPRSAWIAALVSSLLFGLIHLVPMISHGLHFAFFVQLVIAFSLGMVFAGLTIISRSIWPAIFFHFLVDALEFIANGGIGSSLDSIKPEPAFMLTVGISALVLSGWGAFLVWLSSHPLIKEGSENANSNQL